MDLVFISGGVRSGKSAYGEKIALSYCCDCYYLATAVITDDEMQKRVDRHLNDRKDFNFKTIEYHTGIPEILESKGKVVLLDCLTNLVANELFLYNKSKDEVIQYVLKLVQDISINNNLVIVSNDVFSAGNNYLDDTAIFLETLGQIHQEITKICTKAFEVVYQLPIQRK